MGSESRKLGPWKSLFGGGAPKSLPSLPIGIDFGLNSLKILQIAPGSPRSLVAACQVETPAELLSDPKRRLEFQFAQLPRVIREGGFKGRRATCAIPSANLFCKHLQFPKQDNVPTSVLVDAAIPTQLNCDPSSVRYRWFEIGSSNGRTEVVVFAASRDLVERLMRAQHAAKLEPVGLHSEFVACLRAFDDVHRRPPDLDINTLYLDVGAGSTNVLISHGSAIGFARVIAVGGRHLDEALAKQLNCTPREASQRRHSTGQTAGPPPREKAATAVVAGKAGDAFAEVVAETERRGTSGQLPGMSPEVLAQPAAPLAPDGATLAEPVELLTDEVQMCLRYHASQHPDRRVDRAVLVGGEARQRGLCQAIARALKLPTTMADPLARIARTGNEPSSGVDLNQPQPGWVVAMGLCLSPTDL